MKRFFAFLWAALLCLAAVAQTDSQLPQVFSPNAAELGKYGKIPVSYFNGLPNISIPLTELKAKNYTLPIYLTYHAGGNKPDQHPGWVGLGWTLHAGGCISRIAHGYRDELGATESAFMSSGTGYLYHADSLQTHPIDTLFLLKRFGNRLSDYSPDEFLVSCEGLNSSFYFVGDNEVKIVSESAVDYTVEIEMDSTQSLHIFQRQEAFAERFESIKTIRITSSDGTVYTFGGYDDANEHCYELLSNTNGSTTLVRRTDTWNISSIKFPNGEEILFEYVKAGRPIVTTDRVYHEHCDIDPSNPGNPDGLNYPTGSYPYLNYSLISPSYLRRIRSVRTGEELTFTISQTNELAETLNEQAFRGKFIISSGPRYEECVALNYYQQLDRIETPRGRISFEYTDSSQKRLKLLSVTIGNPSVGKYEMTYNTLPLPGYHSRKTDMWGYYSQIQTLDETGSFHPVDSVSVRAEMLQILHYPTGGETRFDYEVHHYGRIATQYPFSLISESGIAGGLRIRKITDVSDGKESTREFRYRTGAGASSGISAMKPRYSARGAVFENAIILQGTDLLSFNETIPSPNVISYSFSGERQLNQIPRTKGSHVTYSRVEECFPNSSKIVYLYTNHDDYPDSSFPLAVCNYDDFGLYNSYCSHELSRGLLKRKEVFSSSDLSSPVLVEENDYYRDLTDNLQGIEDVTLCKGVIRRSAQVVHYTYFPGLHHKTVKSYPDDGGSPFIETSEYTYDNHHRLTQTKRTVGGVTERETFSYTGNYSAQPYMGMRSKNMIAYPVEHLRFRKDTLQSEKVVSAELTTWKQSDTLFVPAEKYKAALGSGMPLSVNNGSGFHPFDTIGMSMASYGSIPELSFTKYDSLGNLVLSEDRDGTPTTYVWTEDGCHPAAIFAGARMGYTRRDNIDVTQYEQLDLEVGDRSVLDFECMAPFTMTLDLSCPQGQNWHLVVRIDDVEYPLTVINSSYTISSWSQSGYGQYPSSRQVSIGSGSHRVNVFVRPTYYAGQGSSDIGCTLNFNYKEKQVTTVNVPGQTVVFEDFEADGNVTSNGYCSDRSHQGTWTHSLTTSGGPYVVDYRVFKNGKWYYSHLSASGSTVSINEGTAPIDHIRIYPLGSLPESYTWNDNGTLRSKTDSRGVTESYEYDPLGRLIFIRDNDGNYVEHYEYNYQNK